MNRRQYRKNWIKLHRSYEKRAFVLFRKHLRASAKRINFDLMTLDNYEDLVVNSIPLFDIQNAYVSVYRLVGELHGKRIGRGINRDIKNFDSTTFVSVYRSFLQQWIFANAGLRIQTVRESLIKYLLGEISKGIEEGLDIRKIAKNMQRLVNSRKFYRWQALRIARTETTAAANYGASIASENSGVVLEKIWISSNDARTRQHEKGDKYDHIDMEAIRVDEKGLFNVQGDLLRFPGDPKGKAANIINCRCTVGMIPKRDENGRLIFK